ncbi:type II toxin-antitoxin system PemK/MazF family toxin [Sphingomonas bacterium]|uniref:type II toxin-antitoxin system PemK/MazF family toxin n=1 Tax=Sphingomonas bacterium TaxID=1895847 RepID=UPI001576447F|nr:type II toxin-antitoxin system PemK/MazF family toxin [Sphingomonas bacterium]
MTRGDIILVRESGSPAAKPRPCVVVQRTSVLAASSKVTACPLTSMLRGAEGQRPLVVPSEANGLLEPSEIQVDWIYTFSIERVGATIGRIDGGTMRQVDVALRRWLEL